MKNVFAILSLTALVGCGIVESVGERTPEEKALMIQTLATTAVTAALWEGIENTNDRIAVARKVRDEAKKVGAALHNGTLTQSAFDAMWDDMDPRVALYIAPSFALFHSAYRIDLDILSPENKLYVDAIAQGIFIGADRVIDASTIILFEVINGNPSFN